MESPLILWQSLALAVIQGITEFLPISSSGHLVIARKLFHWSDESGLVFDTVLHAGSLAAILIYFWRDWAAVLKGYIQPHNVDFAWARRLPWLLVVATLPVVVAGPLLKPFLENEATVRNSVIVGLSMLATALYFWLCELRLAPQPGYAGALRRGESKPLRFLHALWIGCLQIVAFLPGASRSGWTTGGGMLCGQSRESAVRFSFFMALPAIAGAIFFQIKDILASPTAGVAPLQIGLGFLVSFGVSLGAIHFCLRFFRSHTLRGFAIYLAVIGLLVMVCL